MHRSNTRPHLQLAQQELMTLDVDIKAAIDTLAACEYSSQRELALAVQAVKERVERMQQHIELLESVIARVRNCRTDI